MKRTIQLALVVLASVALAACGSKSKGTADPGDGSGTGTGEGTGEGTGDRVMKPEPIGPVTLAEVQQGDAACYVMYEDAEGNENTLPGTFELCPGGGDDATELAGTLVMLQIGRADIMAESCGGDPECPDTEEVDMVEAITPAE